MSRQLGYIFTLTSGVGIVKMKKEEIWLSIMRKLHKPLENQTIRHGPFDILGGLGYFGKKFPCSDFD